MEHKLPPLPFEKSALEPHISSETMDFHYEKHHRAYVDKLNNLIKGTKFEHMPLEEVILSAPEDGPIYDNAAQIWNHTFFWHCIAPGSSGAPMGKVAEAINHKWGNFEKFKEEFSKLALANFGSGWTWLIDDRKSGLEIMNTSNAQTPKTFDQRALLTIDVWEHAYYIDYRNARAKFVDAFWELVNWNFVEQNLRS
jgi:Fe-Mn family superoxide dismutase